MWVEAIFTQEDLRKVVAELAPLKIRLGEEGELLLFAPSEVSILEGKGLRIACQARLHWSVLGFSVPVTVNSLVVILHPIVEKRPDGDALVFKLELEQAHLALVPSVIDEGVAGLVNKELEAKHIELSWNFARTLSHVFRLPDVLETAASLGLVVAWGETRITSEALVFAVSFHANVGRRSEGSAEPGGTPSIEKSTATTMTPRGARSLPLTRARRKKAAVGAALAALTLAGAYMMVRTRTRRRRAWA